MKKITCFVIALAMVLGLSQCKKNVETITSNGLGEMVHITLDVDNGNKADDSSRAIVDPPHVSFENGDRILVGYDGVYVGYLQYNGSVFTGEISASGDYTKPLYFYFLGNKVDVTGLTAGTTTSCDANISEQTGYPSLPVISFSASNETYYGAGNYTARLKNKASLMKFSVTTPSTAAICITGMNNKVTVDFSKPENLDANNGFSYGVYGTGVIKMAAKNADGETWAIVLPQDALTKTGDAYSDDNYYGTRPTMAAIEMNKYLDAGFALTMNHEIPEGAISGRFSVGSTNRVFFSKGNLHATTNNLGSTWTWAFAENQWDKVGAAAANTVINGNGTVSSNGTVDLFVWSTSDTYLGISNITDNTKISNVFADWGSHADVIDGVGTGWRTLTGGQWYHLFMTRETPSGLRFCKAKVGDCFGVILLPDDWNADYYTLYNCNEIEARNFSDNTINNKLTIDEWTNNLEVHGAVFLPCTGQRNNGTTVNAPNGQVHYWSATHSSTNVNAANHVKVDGNGVVPDTGAGKVNGFSVRLVCDVQ